MQNNSNIFSFSHIAALDSGSLYLTGIVNELENNDVKHTILWERIDGVWKRYQNNNRTYGLCAYSTHGEDTAIYMGYEGTLKVRGTVQGSRVEILDDSADGPSSLRSISSIRNINGNLFIAGMRRMVFARHINESVWRRFDDGLVLKKSDLEIAGIYAIDGFSTSDIYAVGLGGEIWKFSNEKWNLLNSKTDRTLLTIRCISNGLVFVGGENGILLISENDCWTKIEHSFQDETFRCIEYWNNRCFVSSDNGIVYELFLNESPRLEVFKIDSLPFTSWMTITTDRIWFAGNNTIMSLGIDGWRDDSPTIDVLTVTPKN